MNETFNFSRFWTYFKYDLKQMWRNHSKAAILIGGASAIFYVIWLLCSLVFTQEWHTPPIEARMVVLILAFGILELYQVRTYGHLTEKRAGSSWLMIPASKAEKYVSMLLITLLVIPLLFFAVYFLIDGFLSLVDPTYGKALLTGAMGAYQSLLEGISMVGEASPISFTASGMLGYTLVGFFCNFLYFLLCGVCFKKNKLVSAIAILFGVSLLFSLLTGILLPSYLKNIDVNLDETQLAEWAVRMMNVSVAVVSVITVGLAWGVWRRIKTIQH
ncbi:MAG: hypothetical protein IKG84_06165 [Bacteroidales bacterium]|nr:hypothetical protein [Bacteroidales bacterium]